MTETNENETTAVAPEAAVVVPTATTADAGKATPKTKPRKPKAATRAAKKVRPPKPAKTPKPASKEKPRKEPSPAEEGLVVFAFRLTQAERDAIHKTAGPAGASRFIRRVAVAFAREEEAAFRAAVKEARDARG